MLKKIFSSFIKINHTKKNQSIGLAPIVLFTYNRPTHLKIVIKALKLDKLSKRSDLIIFSDGKKSNLDTGVAKVRKFLKKIKGFKSVKIIESKNNNGLSAQIINGVTDVINQYGKAIVLEDDIVVSPFFLKFMNDSLVFFENKKKVWHIAGWNFPILVADSNESVLWRMMNCWGWATWKDRWKYFKKDPNECIKTFSKKDIAKFNLDDTHSNFWDQVLLNKQKKINTWDIFWYATIFKHNGLCLNPSVSLVKNVGFDNSGTNCVERNDLFNLEGFISKVEKINFPTKIVEDKKALSQIKKFLKYNQIINRSLMN